MNVSKLSTLVAGCLLAYATSSQALADNPSTWQYRVPLTPNTATTPPQAGELALSASTLNFSNQQANFGQETRNVTLTNTGAFDLAIRSVSGQVDDFAVGSECNNKALTPQKSCTLSVTYRPTGAQGSRGGAYTVAHSGGGASEFVVLGYALKPSLQVPGAVAFADTPVGDTSSKPFTVLNTGAGPVSLTTPSITPAAPYAITGSTCPAQLAAGQSCGFTVSFTPSAKGAATAGTLQLTSGAGTNSASLTGAGLLGALASDAASGLSFSNTLLNTSATSRTVTITNSGNLLVDGLTLSAPEGYSVTNKTCGATLAVSASCTFQTMFSPVTAKDYSGTLTVSAARGLQASIPLSGAGVMPSVTYGNAATATYQVGMGSASGSTLKVYNNGGIPATITSMAVTSKTGNFTAAFASGCSAGKVLQAGETCEIWTSGDGAAGSTHSGTVSVVTTGGTLTFSRTFPVVTVNVAYTPLNPSVSGSALALQVTITNPTSVPFQAVQKNNGPVFGGSAPEYGWFSGLNAANFTWHHGNCSATLVGGGSCNYVLSATGTLTANRTYSTYLQMLGAFPKADSGVVIGTVPSDNTALWLAPQLISYTTTP